MPPRQERNLLDVLQGFFQNASIPPGSSSEYHNEEDFSQNCARSQQELFLTATNFTGSRSTRFCTPRKCRDPPRTLCSKLSNRPSKHKAACSQSTRYHFDSKRLGCRAPPVSFSVLSRACSRCLFIPCSTRHELLSHLFRLATRGLRHASHIPGLINFAARSARSSNHIARLATYPEYPTHSSPQGWHRR